MKKYLILSLILSQFALATPAMAAPRDMSTAQYVASGVLGTIVGLGAGQAAQGRYMKTGWIFTLTQTAGAALFSAGTAYSLLENSLLPITLGLACFSPVAKSEYQEMTKDTVNEINKGTQVALGGAALYGLSRAVDFVDLWVSPLRRNTAAKQN